MDAAPSLPVENDQPVPGYRNYLVFADESGMHGSTYYGFGSLWMPWERRGEFAAIIGSLRREHGYSDECKWSKVNKFGESFYSALVSEFFKTRWLMFHAMVVRKGYVDKRLHNGSLDLARRKHFAKLISTKIAFFSKETKDKVYHLRVDPIASSYKKADEASLLIINRQLNQNLGHPPLKSLIVRDSKETPGIQVADLLLGAVMADWQQESTSLPKQRVKASIAQHLGWSDLRADTLHSEWKFNIWYFFQPKVGVQREAETRPVSLLVPMPRWKGRR